MRISSQTRKAFSQVFSVVVALTILLPQSPHAFAETRQECLQRCIQEEAASITICAMTNEESARICRADCKIDLDASQSTYEACHNGAHDDYMRLYYQAVADYSTAVRTCQNNLAGSIAIAQAAKIAALLVCGLFPPTFPICALTAIITFDGAVAGFILYCEITCVPNARILRDNRLDDLLQDRDARQATCLVDRDVRNTPIIQRKEACLLTANIAYANCRMRATTAKTACDNGCPTEGHGAPPAGHDAPPAGHGAPPAGHGAPPAGHSAPPPG